MKNKQILIVIYDEKTGYTNNMMKLMSAYYTINREIFKIKNDSLPSGVFTSLEIVNQIIDYTEQIAPQVISNIAFCGKNLDLEILGTAIAMSGLYGIGPYHIDIIEDACEGLGKKATKRAIKVMKSFNFNFYNTDEYIQHILH